MSVAAKKIRRLTLEISQLRNDCWFARFDCADRGRVTILLRLATEMIKAGITQARPRRRVRIDFLQIIQNRIDRGVQTVKIHPVKSCRRAFWIETHSTSFRFAQGRLLIESAQPLDELDH